MLVVVIDVDRRMVRQQLYAVDRRSDHGGAERRLATEAWNELARWADPPRRIRCAAAFHQQTLSITCSCGEYASSLMEAERRRGRKGTVEGLELHRGAARIRDRRANLSRWLRRLERDSGVSSLMEPLLRRKACTWRSARSSHWSACANARRSCGVRPTGYDVGVVGVLGR